MTAVIVVDTDSKIKTIVGQDRGTHLSILQNTQTSQHAWNSASIEDTDISRSLNAFSREFQFPLDIELSAIPEINGESNSTLYNYLRNVSSDTEFAGLVVQVLAEEVQEAHR